MLSHHQPDRVRIAFDDHRLVANAGLILPSTPVYPGVGGEPTPDDIGPGQVSKPVVRPGPARHVPSRTLDLGGAQHTPSAPRSVLSNHTNRNYARAWTAFSRWCGNRGIPALPARPSDIVMYLDKMAGRGRRVTTVRAARAAISHGHRTAGYADPTADACVKAFLSGLAKSDSRPPHQAKPLTEAVMAEILATALKPRRTSGCAPRLESTEDAERRGKVDIALVSLLRDALLSRSEAAALRWGDVEWLDNNTGRIFVKRRKTDRGDLWRTPHISEETVSALKAIMPVAALINAEDRIPDRPTGPAVGTRCRTRRRLLRKQWSGWEGAGPVELRPRHPRVDGGGSVEVGCDADQVHQEEGRQTGDLSGRSVDWGNHMTLAAAFSKRNQR